MREWLRPGIEEGGYAITIPYTSSLDRVELLNRARASEHTHVVHLYRTNNSIHIITCVDTLHLSSVPPKLRPGGGGGGGLPPL